MTHEPLQLSCTTITCAQGLVCSMLGIRHSMSRSSKPRCSSGVCEPSTHYSEDTQELSEEFAAPRRQEEEAYHVVVHWRSADPPVRLFVLPSELLVDQDHLCIVPELHTQQQMSYRSCHLPMRRITSMPFLRPVIDID